MEFRGNVGTPLATLFSGNGMVIEQDCSTFFTARLRSSGDNSVAQATRTTSANATSVSASGDLDANQPITLSGGGALNQGSFAFSSATGNVVTGVYLTAIQLATAQGDCVFAGTVQRD